MVLDGKSSQEYPVNAGLPQGSILGPALFLLYINDLTDDVTCNIAIYADNTNPTLLIRIFFRRQKCALVILYFYWICRQIGFS